MPQATPAPLQLSGSWNEINQPLPPWATPTTSSATETTTERVTTVTTVTEDPRPSTSAASDPPNEVEETVTTRMTTVTRKRKCADMQIAEQPNQPKRARQMFVSSASSTSSVDQGWVAAPPANDDPSTQLGEPQQPPQTPSPPAGPSTQLGEQQKDAKNDSSKVSPSHCPPGPLPQLQHDSARQLNQQGEFI